MEIQRHSSGDLYIKQERVICRGFMKGKFRNMAVVYITMLFMATCVIASSSYQTCRLRRGVFVQVSLRRRWPGCWRTKPMRLKKQPEIPLSLVSFFFLLVLLSTRPGLLAPFSFRAVASERVRTHFAASHSIRNQYGEQTKLACRRPGRWAPNLCA